MSKKTVDLKGYIKMRWGKGGLQALEGTYGTYPNQFKGQEDKKIIKRNEIIRELRSYKVWDDKKKEWKSKWSLRQIIKITGLKSPQAILDICKK